MFTERVTPARSAEQAGLDGENVTDSVQWQRRRDDGVGTCTAPELGDGRGDS